METWRAAGLPVSAFDLLGLRAFSEMAATGTAGPVLDVRAPAEWDTDHLERSVWSYVPHLTDGVPGPVREAGRALAARASGFRAWIAAGLLERAGIVPTVLDGAGIPGLRDRLRWGRASTRS